MGLGDADGQVTESTGLEQVKPLRRRRQEVDALGPVHLGGDGHDLVPQRRLGRIEEAELVRLLGCGDHRVGQFGGPGTAVAEVGGHRRAHPHRVGHLPDGVVLGLEVPGEGVDGHHRRHPVEEDVLDLLAEVG